MRRSSSEPDTSICVLVPHVVQSVQGLIINNLKQNAVIDACAVGARSSDRGECRTSCSRAAFANFFRDQRNYDSNESQPVQFPVAMQLGADAAPKVSVVLYSESLCPE